MKKLVRDRIPELMANAGEAVVVRVLHDDGEYLHALQAKLREEFAEWQEKGTDEELGDIIDVVQALRDHANLMSDGLFELHRLQKYREKGGFAARQFVETPSADDEV